MWLYILCVCGCIYCVYVAAYIVWMWLRIVCVCCCIYCVYVAVYIVCMWLYILCVCGCIYCVYVAVYIARVLVVVCVALFGSSLLPNIATNYQSLS